MRFLNFLFLVKKKEKALKASSFVARDRLELSTS